MLVAEGNAATLNFASMDQSVLPAIRMYPAAPAQGGLGATVSAVWEAAVPGGRAIARQTARLLPPSAFKSASSFSSASASSFSSPSSAAAGLMASASQAAHDRGDRAQAFLPTTPTATGIDIARATFPQARPADVLIAASTLVMLDEFLSQVGFTPGALCIGPGLLLAPNHRLLSVLAARGAVVVPFDFSVDTMEIDMASVRSALFKHANNSNSSPPSSSSPAVILLVGIRGRAFSNAAAVHQLAARHGCAVATVHPPTLQSSSNAAAVGIEAGIDNNTATASGVASIEITSFDGPGSLGGAIALCNNSGMTSAMHAALAALPATGPLAAWPRLARQVCAQLISDRLDYGGTVWTLAVLSRVARAASDMILGTTASRVATLAGSVTSSRGSGGGGAVDTTAPTAMDAARQQAMDWIYDLLLSDDTSITNDRNNTTTRISSGAIAKVQTMASRAVTDSKGRQAGLAGVKDAAATGAAALLKMASESKAAAAAVAAAAGMNVPTVDTTTTTAAAATLSRLLAVPVSLLSSLSSPSLSLLNNASSASVVRSAARPHPTTLRWLRRLLSSQAAAADADALCLWYLLYSLPSYARVASAGASGGGGDPLACVESGLSSIVLLARCPVLIARQLQRAGFAAMPIGAVAVSTSTNSNSNSASGIAAATAAVHAVNGAVFFPSCGQCAAAAPQLCLVPLSPHMSVAAHQSLIDTLSEVPRPWHTGGPQPVATPTMSNYRRTGGGNFSSSDRPYNTPSVRAVLLAISLRHAAPSSLSSGSNTNANSSKNANGSDGADTTDLDAASKKAMQKLFTRRHPLLTYLWYGTHALGLLVPKL